MCYYSAMNIASVGQPILAGSASMIQAERYGKAFEVEQSATAGVRATRAPFDVRSLPRSCVMVSLCIKAYAHVPVQGKAPGLVADDGDSEPPSTRSLGGGRAVVELAGHLPVLAGTHRFKIPTEACSVFQD